MKKILAIAAALMLLVPAAYALESIQDMDLDEVTGQAGITLNAIGGNIVITQSMNALSWGDDDGYTGAGGTAAGHLGIWALSAAGATATMGANINLSGLTLDVDVNGIFLGLTGLSVTVNNPDRMRFTVASGVTGATYAYSSATTLGDLWMENATVGVTIPGVLQIAPH
jgi:opacity protein-like surface antigen